MTKRPILCCFGVDGTVSQGDGTAESHEQLLQTKPHQNVLDVVMQVMRMPNAEIMFCSARPKQLYGVTWRWLNRHLDLARAGRPVSLVCRPPELAIDAVPQYKLGEVVQAIRRQPEKLAELRCYDATVKTLRLMQTLRPMVSTLRLYRVENGLTSQWGS